MRYFSYIEQSKLPIRKAKLDFISIWKRKSNYSFYTSSLWNEWPRLRNIWIRLATFGAAPRITADTVIATVAVSKLGHGRTFLINRQKPNSVSEDRRSCRLAAFAA